MELARARVLLSRLLDLTLPLHKDSTTVLGEAPTWSGHPACLEAS